ncbi:hypothetical protein [Desulfobulbus oligotrophicus]|jgi:hypothetical protein|uniref:Lipoprotein n=1 Tax=Desulfobulbus oligotrophicus TaxID=1909699 RepID=A0A7T5VE16_9BACT|nr:hypothetical protein [Desulfobulbus oligotrophicus]MDY0391482.1 hypothetical protein [Desulfobulbus oligotrophicus]QQG66177.1 hypothetical protein HP555_10030 [Desulfobulbus oligotrophicus]
MHNQLFRLLFVMLLCTFTGCAKDRYSGGSAMRGSMESTEQWNVLANHVADRINNELIRQQRLDATVYVRHSCGQAGICGSHDSFPFDEGFNDLLTTQLVNFGVHTVRTPEKKSLVIEYKVQTVYHPSEYRAWSWPKPGALIALAAGIVVFEDAPWELIAAATAIDVFRSNYQSGGHYEVIITTSILDKHHYLMRSSDIYYIKNADYWHYQAALPATEIRLTGSKSSVAPPPPQKTAL